MEQPGRRGNARLRRIRFEGHDQPLSPCRSWAVSCSRRSRSASSSAKARSRQINPIHFQGPAVHPRDRGAAIDESQPAARPRATRIAVYGWDQGYAARAADCDDCGRRARAALMPIRPVVPYFGADEESAEPADPRGVRRARSRVLPRHRRPGRDGRSRARGRALRPLSDRPRRKPRFADPPPRTSELLGAGRTAQLFIVRPGFSTGRP